MNNQLMTAEEIHEFGVEIVFNELRKDDHEILSVNTDLGMNPQIVARKNGDLKFVIVRTACYPHKGQIESEELAMECIAHADKFNAICYFASVGIAYAAGTTEDEMAGPVKGAAFLIAFEGLLTLTRSDRVKVWGPDGISDLAPNDVNGIGGP